MLKEFRVNIVIDFFYQIWVLKIAWIEIRKENLFIY
jgi:hypothetical protein